MTDMFRIYFTNHGYWCERQFATLAAALEHGKSVHFEFSVHCGSRILVAWSPLYGERSYR
jgi:hypothetical protein